MNNWTCEQTEARLSDYLEGLLQPAERMAFDAHVATCKECAAIVASVEHVVTSMHAMEEVEPPPQLIYSILDKTLGPRDAVTGWGAAWAWIRGLANPRFAYGAVSVTATFLMIATASGFSWRKPKLADLRPATVYRNADRQAHLVYARSTKFVSDLRVVYEIQARWHEDTQIPTTPEEVMPQTAPGKNPGSSDGSSPNSPRQQNRADEVKRDLEVLAVEFAPESVVSLTRRMQ